MSVRPVTYYEITCDHDGCDWDLADATGEFTGSAALDQWRDANGVVLEDGRTFCELHAPGDDEATAAPEPARPAAESKVIDLMAALEDSVTKAKAARQAPDVGGATRDGDRP